MPSIWCQAPSFGRSSMRNPNSDNTPSMSTNSSGSWLSWCNFVPSLTYLFRSKAGSLGWRSQRARVKWVQRGADGMAQRTGSSAPR